MNLEVVSVESPRLVPSQPSTPDEVRRKTAFGNYGRDTAERNTSEVLLKQVLIEIALEKIAAHGLCGREYVQQYLMDLYRRNCRPNTIRSRFAFIFLFLKYLKAQGWHLLELVRREDVCGECQDSCHLNHRSSRLLLGVGSREFFFRFRIEPHESNRLPVSSFPRPAVRTATTGLLVNAMAVFQDGLLAAIVAIIGSHEADRAVQMHGIVPDDELIDPGLRFFQTLEGPGRILWTVLQGSKEGLRVGIVITDAGTREGGHYAQLLQGGQHGGALHRSAVIGMQHEALGVERMGQTRNN